MFPITSRFRK